MINEHLYNQIINSSMRVTRRIQHTDFSEEQLEEVKDVYWEKRYLNVAETAIFLGIGYQTVYKLIDEGKVVKKEDYYIKKPFLIDIKKSWFNLNHL